jgi:hypothetical protein
VLQSDVEDSIHWRLTPSGVYSMSSTYAALLQGQTSLLGAKEVWKVKTPREHKFFIWFVIQGRCSTSERLQHHGMDNSGMCALCEQNIESIDHLLLSYDVSREIWFKTLRLSEWQALVPTPEDRFVEWWLASRKLATKA